MTKNEKLFSGFTALALVLGLALATTPAMAQGKSQNDKKPGQTCQGEDKASKAFSDCVKAQAQTTKDARQGDKTNAGKKPKS